MNKETLTEENFSMEQLDAIAKSLEKNILTVDSVPYLESVTGKIETIKPTNTLSGIRLDIFGTTTEGVKFQTSSWSCNIGKLKPSEILQSEYVTISNKGNKSLIMLLGKLK